jgi:hypothetical protein
MQKAAGNGRLPQIYMTSVPSSTLPPTATADCAFLAITIFALLFTMMVVCLLIINWIEAKLISMLPVDKQNR